MNKTKTSKVANEKKSCRSSERLKFLPVSSGVPKTSAKQEFLGQEDIERRDEGLPSGEDPDRTVDSAISPKPRSLAISPAGGSHAAPDERPEFQSTAVLVANGAAVSQGDALKKVVGYHLENKTSNLR